MAIEKIKLPRSSYEELCRIIKAYGSLIKEASRTEVSQTSGVHQNVVSANNAFLSNIGIIEGGQKKTVTFVGKSIAHALDANIPEEIEKHWRQVIESSEFLSKIVAAIRIRNGMEATALKRHIAYSAGEKSAGYVMTGARTVIDILLASNLAVEDEGILTIDEIKREVKELEIPSSEGITPEESKAQPIQYPEGVNSIIGPGLSLNIELRIEVKASELDGLGKKIKGLLDEISNSSEEDSQE